METTTASKTLNDIEYRLLNACIKRFADKGMDVGNIMFAPMHRRKGAWGYCYEQDNWEMSKNGAKELGLTPSCIVAGVEQMVNTITHELVHAYNGMNGIHDCNGQVHNGRFKKTCEMVGLSAKRKDRRGYSTDLEDREEDCIKWENELIQDTLTIEELEFLQNVTTYIPTLVERKAKDRNLKVFVCPECGAKARASPNTALCCGGCTYEGHIVDMVMRL